MIYRKPEPVSYSTLFQTLHPTTPCPKEIPSQSHSPTSRAAAASLPNAETLRAKVLEAIRAHGADGLTDEEGMTRTGIGPSTYRPRRVSLVEDGLVRDSGTVRQAIVWQAVELAAPQSIPATDPGMDRAQDRTQQNGSNSIPGGAL